VFVDLLDSDVGIYRALYLSFDLNFISENQLQKQRTQISRSSKLEKKFLRQLLNMNFYSFSSINWTPSESPSCVLRHLLQLFQRVSDWIVIEVRVTHHLPDIALMTRAYFARDEMWWTELGKKLMAFVVEVSVMREICCEVCSSSIDFRSKLGKSSSQKELLAHGEERSDIRGKDRLLIWTFWWCHARRYSDEK
jgi:hypothetical protein